MPSLTKISGEETFGGWEKLVLKESASGAVTSSFKRQTADGDIGCVVPLHKELAIGTLHGILKQAKASIKEFAET